MGYATSRNDCRPQQRFTTSDSTVAGNELVPGAARTRGTLREIDDRNHPADPLDWPPFLAATVLHGSCGMSLGQLAAVLVGTATLSFAAACGKGGGSPTSPSGGGGGTPATFTDEGVHFAGAHPAPVVVNGAIYVYQNTGTDGTMVQASPNGLAFALTPASFPAGISRTIVSLPDGRFRMYYFADGTSVDVRSAVSNNGLNWTVEDGTRYSDPGIGAIRATVLPGGGYRLYYPNGTGISSAMSSDGLTFVTEGPVMIPPPDGTWGASAAAYVDGKFHMVLTRAPSSGSTDLWHAVSTDGRSWTVDSRALAANPGVSLNQPAWTGSTARIYYRAQPPGGGNMIGSGIIKF